MSEKVEQVSLFEDETTKGPVTCLGLTFNNDDERREYFREELRGKLPKLRELEGFPIGLDEDIIALSDPPYYTACPNPWINNFINDWSKNIETKYSKKPFTADVSEGKYHKIYKFHPYPTKVPHRAIMRYLLHYTNPGDIVADIFSGTGITGVAAQLCGDKKEVEELGYKVDASGYVYEKVEDENGKISWNQFSRIGERKTILSDISTSATFIANNFNLKDSSIKEVEKSISEIEKKLEGMYYTLHRPSQDQIESAKTLLINDGNSIKNKLNNSSLPVGYINYVAWSDIFICPECSEEIVYWDTAVEKDNGKIHEKFHCPNCRAVLRKGNIDRSTITYYDTLLGKSVSIAKQKPVLINYIFSGQRFVKEPDDFDLTLIDFLNNLEFPNWVPNEELPEGVNTSQPKVSHGFTHVHQFYTYRNVRVLSDFVNICKTDVGRKVLLRVASRITKMYGLTFQSGIWGAGGGPLSGTLYVPSLIKELNMIEHVKKSIKMQQNKDWTKGNDTLISTSSSTDLKVIPNDSIDYLFIDPPFGGNLMYSELNFIWESWLKVKTNNFNEAIVNSKQSKDLSDYKHLITLCFKEAFRILKPGRWITIEFSNTKASVWNTIQNSIEEAGFVIANVSALDKQKGSVKAITSTVAVKQDLVISAYKPSQNMIEEIEKERNSDSAWAFVSNHLKNLPVFVEEKGTASTIVERTPRVLFDRLVAYNVQNGYQVPISSAEFQAKLLSKFPSREGMVFLEDQVAEYDKKRIRIKTFTQLNLFVSDENSAIEWIRQQLMYKPQTRQDLHPNFMREIQHIAKHELLPELDDLLEQNFLMYDGNEDVPSQIHGYLSSNYKDLRNLEKSDPKLKEKGKNRWYVPDPNKQADLEKLREKSLLREFESYKTEIEGNKKKLKQFRTEAIRTGFKKAWSEKDFETIVKVGERLPEKVIQEDDKLLMYFDQAQIRIGM